MTDIIDAGSRSRYKTIKCRVKYSNRDAVLIEVDDYFSKRSVWIPTSQVQMDYRSIEEGELELSVSEWYLYQNGLNQYA